jgi:thiamine biosynthesis lipoprotein ApbE
VRGGETPTGRLGAASWSALGSTVVLRVGDPAALPAARAGVARELDAIDWACSRFRPDSELSRLNAGNGRPIRVSALLMEALELSLRAAELTDGDVDPTVGRALELAGYDRDWRLLTPAPEPAHAPALAPVQPRITLRSRQGWRSLVLDLCCSTARLPRGIRLDLGATAKAWAADRSARAAAAAGGCGALVGIGGDIATSGEAPRGGWLVHVTDDHRGDVSAQGQTITMSSGGLATSSTTVRRWRQGPNTNHHIIDPRTGAPAHTPWRTVSIAAASCTEANIATTAALVRGATASRWLERLGLPARLVGVAGNTLLIGAWPAPATRELAP